MGFLSFFSPAQHLEQCRHMGIPQFRLCGINLWTNGWINFSIPICYVEQTSSSSIFRSPSNSWDFQEVSDGWLWTVLWHTCTHTHLQTPVTFHPRILHPELPCAPKFFSGASETFPFLLLGQGRELGGRVLWGGVQGLTKLEVLSKAKFIAAPLQRRHSSDLANKPLAGKIISLEATWCLRQIVTVWDSPLALRPSGHNGPQRWTHCSPRLGQLLRGDKALLLPFCFVLHLF